MVQEISGAIFSLFAVAGVIFVVIHLIREGERLTRENAKPENVAKREAAWEQSRREREIKADRKAAEKKAKQDAAEREAQAVWEQAQLDLALSCITRVGELPCSGLAAPIRGTKDRYRCPVCGGQFAGARHGW